MTQIDKDFLRRFFLKVQEGVLDPDHPCYVKLYEGTKDDPVELLAQAIEWTPRETVQLFSGYRGSGKSTELNRLRRRLMTAGYVVILCDLEDHLNMSTPVDVSDFLLAAASAFAERVDREVLDNGQLLTDSYIRRLVDFLKRTKVDLSELSLSPDLLGIAEIKLGLKTDPVLKRRLQARLAGHLGTLVKEVGAFFEECLAAIQTKRGPTVEVVFLVDSIEHIRGTFETASAVQASVENLFASHADHLKIPGLHVVYTIPPWLRVRYQNLGTLYQPGGIQMLRPLRVITRDRKPVPAIRTCLQEVIQKRGDWSRLLGGDGTQLQRVIEVSGGHLRDLMRLMSEVIKRAALAHKLPVGADLVSDVIQQVRSEFLPISEKDGRWLAKISTKHDCALETAEELPVFARFLDTHVVLCYQNGEEWYDVHPLIREEVLRLAASGSAAS